MPSGRILLVEDNPVNRFLVRCMLENGNRRVDMAENGREAVDLACRRQYDLILMDCLMPEMDGFEATRRIRARETGTGRSVNGSYATPTRQQRAQVPIVAITTNARSRRRCLESGMNDHLRKPFDQEQLSDVVERWALKAGPLTLTQSSVGGCLQ